MQEVKEVYEEFGNKQSRLWPSFGQITIISKLSKLNEKMLEKDIKEETDIRLNLFSIASFSFTESRKFFSTPASSFYSEWSFSEAKNIYINSEVA